jgi:hypothetical protein
MERPPTYRVKPTCHTSRLSYSINYFFTNFVLFFPSYACYIYY